MFGSVKNYFGFYEDDMPIESGLYGVKSYRKGDNKRMVTPDGKWFIEERSFRIAYTFILNIDNKETPTLGHLKRVAQVRGDLAREQIDEVMFKLYGKAGKPSIPTEEQKRSGYSSQAEYNRDDRNAVRLRSVKFGDQHDDLLAHLNKKNWGLYLWQDKESIHYGIKELRKMRVRETDHDQRTFVSSGLVSCLIKDLSNLNMTGGRKKILILI